MCDDPNGCYLQAVDTVVQLCINVFVSPTTDLATGTVITGASLKALIGAFLLNKLTSPSWNDCASLCSDCRLMFVGMIVYN